MRALCTWPSGLTMIICLINIDIVMSMISLGMALFKNDPPSWWMFRNLSFIAQLKGDQYIFHEYEFLLKFIMQSSTIAKLADYF